MMTHINVILKKSWSNKSSKKVLPVGKIVPCDPQLAEELISKGIAEKYTGTYPPVQKVKTDFFKPKNK
jgi:hypothetical protein